LDVEFLGLCRRRDHPIWTGVQYDRW